jgi:hypothetical protein
LSTSTLSLKIFRLRFQTEDIPILSNNIDKFVRSGYYGGATDYYKAYGTNLHYYDVNSLYPFSMLKPMPYIVLDTYKDMSNIKLENFFGFFEAKITSPDIMKPLHYKGKTP